MNMKWSHLKTKKKKKESISNLIITLTALNGHR